MANPLMNLMGNPLQQMLLNKLQQINPSGYNRVKEAMTNNKSPQELLGEVMKEKHMTSEELAAFKNSAHSLGVPNDVLDNLR